jgi:hypothetical protein
MGAQTPIPVPPAPTASTKALVEIFSAGQVLPSGKVADLPFLEKVVANWHQYQAKRTDGVRPAPAYLIPAASITLGHEELSSIAKKYAERTDLPALGWPADVQIVGSKLCCRFKNVPVSLVQWIEAKLYTEISAEFYEDHDGLGPVLRRVSVLGAEIPKCKDLAPIPQFFFDETEEQEQNILAFAEKTIKQSKTNQTLIGVGNYVLKFSEKSLMDRNQLIAALKDAGVDVSFINDATANELLASMLQALQKKAPAPNTEPPKGDDMPPAMNIEEEVKKQVAANTERIRKEVAAEMEKSKAFHDAELKRLQDERARQEIAAFCEKYKDRIYPYELDPKVGVTLQDRLFAMSDQKVLKFSEGGKEIALSPREAEMLAISKRPPVMKNREILPDQHQGVGAVTPERRRELLSHTAEGRKVLAREKAG